MRRNAKQSMLYAISGLTSIWIWELVFVHSLLHKLSSLSVSRIIRPLKVQLLNVTHNFNSSIFSSLGELSLL